MVTGWIYFVGGAAGSGKSIATKEIAQQFDVPLIKLDDLFNSLEEQADEDTRRKILNVTAPWLVRQLLNAGATAIIEGGWIQPQEAHQLVNDFKGRLCAVFCGYPSASAPERLQIMKSVPDAEQRHRIANKEEKEAIEELNKQIRESASYQKQAGNHGLTFIDFSNFDRGKSHLCNDFKTWLDEGPRSSG